jgi:hypothetical protein
MKDIRIGSNPKKMGFWIGFGWETLNPPKKAKSKKSKIQTQKTSENPNPKKNQKSIKSKPKSIITFFWGFLNSKFS